MNEIVGNDNNVCVELNPYFWENVESSFLEVRHPTLFHFLLESPLIF